MYIGAGFQFDNLRKVILKSSNARPRRLWSFSVLRVFAIASTLLGNFTHNVRPCDLINRCLQAQVRVISVLPGGCEDQGISGVYTIATV